MKIVIQKVSEANVVVHDEYTKEFNVVGSILTGYVLLVGIESGDTEVDTDKAADKVSSLRLFEDGNGKINLSVHDVGGSILSISQFTLAADIRKGNRPSFSGAMEQSKANALYEKFNERLRSHGLKVQTGQFQTDMSVSLVNEGPVSIIMVVKDGKVL
jgi:D-aminoacyl-tRNA deacylase